MKRKLLLITFILGVAAASAQTLVSITPNTGTRGQTLNVTITGNNTHFQSGSGTSVMLFTSGSPTYFIAASSTTAISNTTLNVSFFISASATTGLYNLGVSNFMDGLMTLGNSFTVLATGVAETADEIQKLSVYPNPALNMVSIELNRQDAEVMEVEVSDLVGRRISRIQLPGITSDGRLELDIRKYGIPPGTYFIKVTTSKQVYLNKVLIE